MGNSKPSKGRDTLDDILSDVDYVYGWVDGVSQAERAKDYLSKRKVMREPETTVLQAAAADLVKRANALNGENIGLKDGERLGKAVDDLLDVVNDIL